LTDGFIPQQIVLLYGSKTLAQKLVDARLWRAVVDGWEMNDFLTYNKSRSQVLAERADSAERQRRLRARRDPGTEELDFATADSNDVSHGVTEPSESPSNTVTNEMSHLPRPVLPLSTKESNITCAQGKSSDPFDEFWSSYPRTVQKQDARKAWTQQLRKNVTPEQMTTGAKGYAAYHQRRNTDQEFIKHPASWLRAGGYEDFQPEAPPEMDARTPVEILRDLWRAADAQAVARILRVPYSDPGQPPSDPTPHAKWIRARHQEWIEEHRDTAIKVLTEKAAEMAAEETEGHV
jgi:hypothetical protein